MTNVSVGFDVDQRVAAAEGPTGRESRGGHDKMANSD